MSRGAKLPNGVPVLARSAQAGGLAFTLLIAGAITPLPGSAAPIAQIDREEARRHPPDDRAHRTGTGTNLSAGGIPIAITFRPYMGATRAFLDVGRGEHPCPHLSNPELVIPLSSGRALKVGFYSRGTWLISRTALSRLPTGSSFVFTRCGRRERVGLP